MTASLGTASWWKVSWPVGKEVAHLHAGHVLEQVQHHGVQVIDLLHHGVKLSVGDWQHIEGG